MTKITDLLHLFPSSWSCSREKCKKKKKKSERNVFFSRSSLKTNCVQWCGQPYTHLATDAKSTSYSQGRLTWSFLQRQRSETSYCALGLREVEDSALRRRRQKFAALWISEGTWGWHSLSTRLVHITKTKVTDQNYNYSLKKVIEKLL